MDEKSTNLIFLAIVLSVLVHGGLMFFIRPQVMTHITGSGASTRERAPMRVRERPPVDDSVRLDVVEDIAAERSFPQAETEDLIPATDDTLKDMAEARQLPQVTEDQIKDVSVPVLAFDPSEILSRPVSETKDELRPAVSPIAPGAGGFSDGVFAGASTLKAVPSPLVAAAVPEVKAPSLSDIPFAEIDHGEAVGDDASSILPDRTPEPFVPVKEVMAEVDEKIVETEKAAVRELLDVREAKELATFVNTVAVSATQGDWTYFKVSVMPRADLKTVPKDVVILIDASGSIANDRLRSCRKNAKKILRTCMNSHDRFNIVAFRDDFSYAFKTWQECDKESYERAEDWMDSLAAYGRTDVFATAASVLKLPRDPKRPLIALIVTDGIANKGVRETSQILSRFTRLNDGLISVYMYGVKDEANRELIDVLTRGNRGESFIHEGRRKYAGRELEQLSDRFRDPVLTDLRVVFTSDSRAEALPVLLKNLYKGGMVDIIGRVPKGVDEVAFSLKGLNADKAYEGFFRFRLSKTPFDGKIPALWAAERSIDQKLR